MQVLAPMTGLSLARVSNRRLGRWIETPRSPYWCGFESRRVHQSFV